MKEVFILVNLVSNKHNALNRQFDFGRTVFDILIFRSFASRSESSVNGSVNVRKHPSKGFVNLANATEFLRS